MIVYIAGPMSGHEDYNRPAFNDAARRLAEAGHVPINPAVLPTELNHSAYMPICTSMIDGADAIYLLDGWERSGGAMTEFAYARRQGKRIYTQAQLLGSRAAGQHCPNKTEILGRLLWIQTATEVCRRKLRALTRQLNRRSRRCS